MAQRCFVLNMIHRKSTAYRIVNSIHIFTHLRSREHDSIRVPGDNCELPWTYSVDLSVKPYQTQEEVGTIWQTFLAKCFPNTAALTTDFSPYSLQFNILATSSGEIFPQFSAQIQRLHCGSSVQSNSFIWLVCKRYSGAVCCLLIENRCILSSW